MSVARGGLAEYTASFTAILCWSADSPGSDLRTTATGEATRAVFTPLSHSAIDWASVDVAGLLDFLRRAGYTTILGGLGDAAITGLASCSTG